MTISTEIMSAFSDELAKLAVAPAQAAKMSGKMKALLGVTGVAGIGAGMVGEQAKDDLVQGRTMRRQQARQQGIRPMFT
jgi:hypothetical protein